MADTPADPVKARSSFLSSYMSSHTDTLVAYVIYFGKVKETPTTAKMASIDQKKMDLSYQVKGSEEWKSVSVEFDPPLSGYEEVKPRLMQMKADAEEQLGMAKTPPLTTFSLKPGSFRAVPVLFILAVFSLAPYHQRIITKEEVPPFLYPLLPHANTALHFLTSVRRGLPFTPTTAHVLWTTIAVIHIAFALLVGLFSYQRRASLNIAVSWVISALLLSYPAVFEFRSHLQASRIDSIGKNH